MKQKNQNENLTNMINLVHQKLQNIRSKQANKKLTKL